jgi:hypothetical protein
MSFYDDLRAQFKRIHDAIHLGTLDMPSIDDALTRLHEHVAAHETGSNTPNEPAPGSATVQFTDPPAQDIPEGQTTSDQTTD